MFSDCVLNLYLCHTIVYFISFKDAELEANHHCTVGVTGVLCMPQYLLHNVDFKKAGGRWLWFQSFRRGDHSYTQPEGGIFSLSPPNAAIVMNGGTLVNSLFPIGYVSVVSSKFTYLLDHPNRVCVKSSDISPEMENRYDRGILCKVPLRSLKVYSRNQLTRNNPPDLRVNAWFNGSRNGAPNAAQNLRYHQSGPDNIPHKQGYSIPVIPGAENTYRLSLVNGRNVPNDWVIEFNDPVIGNRWGEEFIRLEVQGRTCANNGLVSSQHDRRFIWSGDEFLNSGVWDGNGKTIHGACVATGGQPPSMPVKSCSSNSRSISNLSVIEGDNAAIKHGKLIKVAFASFLILIHPCSVHLMQRPPRTISTADGPEPTECPELCSQTCNGNSYCDCGTAKCMCKAGFAGNACSTDLCAAARCGSNGVCSAKYLGPGTSGTLPVTSENACICKSGFSGNLCDRNPCKNKNCNGNGYCIANGLEAKCVCDDGYSGDNCQVSCDNFCSGTFPYNCNPNLGPQIVKYGCIRNGGACAYLKEGEEYNNPNDWCTFKEKNTGNECKCSTMNQCQTIGSCSGNGGNCPQPIPVPDGTPCNSVPWGICKNGKCKASISPPTSSPITSPTKPPTFESNPPTNSPTDAPTMPCTENPKDQFFHRWNKSVTPKKPIFKNCRWLAKKKPRNIQKNCNKTRGGGGKGPARDVCFNTCNSCSRTSSPTKKATMAPSPPPVRTFSPTPATPPGGDTDEIINVRTGGAIDLHNRIAANLQPINLRDDRNYEEIAQLWSIDQEGRIRSAVDSSYCLEAGTDQSLYKKAFLYKCNDGLHQQWEFRSDGRIRSRLNTDFYLGVAYCGENSDPDKQAIELRYYEDGACGVAQKWRW